MSEVAEQFGDMRVLLQEQCSSGCSQERSELCVWLSMEVVGRLVIHEAGGV